MNLAHIGTYEKLGLFALGMVVFVVVAPKAMAFFMGSVASIATIGRPPGAPAAPRRPERQSATSSAPTDLGFGRDAVEAVGGDWHAASALNAALLRLQQHRSPSVALGADTLQSKIAWKVAVSSQAALYRLVALADAATTLWNFRNPLGAIVTATALLENAAVFAAFEQTLGQLTAAGDLPAVDAFVVRAGFTNAFESVAGAAQARTPTPIGALPAAAQIAYTQLAGIAEAQALTHYAAFGALDKTNVSVAFSETASFENAVLNQLLAAIGVVDTITERMAAIEALLSHIASPEKE